MDEITEKINVRIKELEEQLQKLVEDANKNIVAHQAAIGELRHLIGLDVDVPVQKEEDEDDMNYHK